jgi:hypothetical protein
LKLTVGKPAVEKDSLDGVPKKRQKKVKGISRVLIEEARVAFAAPQADDQDHDSDISQPIALLSHKRKAVIDETLRSSSCTKLLAHSALCSPSSKKNKTAPLGLRPGWTSQAKVAATAVTVKAKQDGPIDVRTSGFEESDDDAHERVALHADNDATVPKAGFFSHVVPILTSVAGTCLHSHQPCCPHSPGQSPTS